MSADELTGGLPPTITRPFRRACVGLLIFLGGVVIWACFASISTTLRVNGNFVSSQPSYELQHPFGGKISQVFVTLHQMVKKGDPILLLDVRTHQQKLRETESQLARITRENQIIRTYLLKQPILGQTGPDLDFLELQYRESDLTFHSKLNAQRNVAESSRERLEAVTQGIQFLQERRDLLKTRAEEKYELVSRGILRRQVGEVLTDAILTVGSELAEQTALAISLETEATQSEIAEATLTSEYRTNLVSQFNTNDQRMPELRRQIAGLRSEIGSAMVLAPVSGTVVSLQYDTAQMYAGKGQTLTTLAQFLDKPVLHLKIPVSTVDQVYVGMEGKLTIPALSQRDMPEVKLALTSLAPEAQKDPEGVPTHYSAVAKIDQSDLDRARRIMGDRLRLVTDMPVSVALAGRNTTMAHYLFDGFANILSDALQD